MFEDRAYILSRSESAGGRGINASRVIHAFGGKTLAVMPSGGESGARFEELVRGYGFPVEMTPIKNQMRTNLTITDRQGLTIKLNEAGPEMEKSEVEALVCDYGKANAAFGYEPAVGFREGLTRLRDHLAERRPTSDPAAYLV